MSRRESHVIIDGAKLLAKLNARAMSAADLAARADVSTTTLSAIQAGRPVSARTARKIAKALADVPPAPELVDLLTSEVA